MFFKFFYGCKKKTIIIMKSIRTENLKEKLWHFCWKYFLLFFLLLNTKLKTKKK